MIYLQLIVGATMRHYDAGLAIPDLPLAYGKLLPPMSHEALREVNHYRAWELNLDPVTLPQIWLHFGHRIGAILVTLMVVCFVLAAIRIRIPPLGRWAALLGGLLALQLTLGVLTVLLGKPADLASAHVAVGALVLVTCFVTTVRAGRIFRTRSAARAASDGPAILDQGGNEQLNLDDDHGLVRSLRRTYAEHYRHN
jgi:cytochrome c oxidase assembly protein subunit 15